MLEFSDDILENIFPYNTPPELARLAMSCQRLKVFMAQEKPFLTGYKQQCAQAKLEWLFKSDIEPTPTQLELLLKEGAVLHQVIKNDATQATLLHMAAQKNWFHITPFLLAKGVADVLAKNIQGQTALHLAAMHAHAGLTYLLMNYSDKALKLKIEQTHGGPGFTWRGRGSSLHWLFDKAKKAPKDYVDTTIQLHYPKFWAAVHPNILYSKESWQQAHAEEMDKEEARLKKLQFS